MVTETLAPDETKTFRGWPKMITPIHISIESGGATGSVEIDLQGFGFSQVHDLTDAAPLDLRCPLSGTAFTVKNTGASTLSVETSALEA